MRGKSRTGASVSTSARRTAAYAGEERDEEEEEEGAEWHCAADDAPN